MPQSLSRELLDWSVGEDQMDDLYIPLAAKAGANA
jgi:hypothetical protein